MSEADYMDDCQQVDRYDDAQRRRNAGQRYCVIRGGRVVLVGSRVVCWQEQRAWGGWVQPYND